MIEGGAAFCRSGAPEFHIDLPPDPGGHPAVRGAGPTRQDGPRDRDIGPEPVRPLRAHGPGARLGRGEPPRWRRRRSVSSASSLRRRGGPWRDRGRQPWPTARAARSPMTGAPLSPHQPQALSWPPLATKQALPCLKAAPPLGPRHGMPAHAKPGPNAPGVATKRPGFRATADPPCSAARRAGANPR